MRAGVHKDKVERLRKKGDRRPLKLKLDDGNIVVTVPLLEWCVRRKYKPGAKIFEAKSRPFFDPIIAHVADLDQIDPLVSEFPKKARRLMGSLLSMLSSDPKRAPIDPPVKGYEFRKGTRRCNPDYRRRYRRSDPASYPSHTLPLCRCPPSC